MRHIPVLLEETIENLNLKPGMNVIDCTLGDAGHAEAILERIGPKGKLLGIDSDVEAILRAKRYLYRFEERVIFARDNFANLNKIVQENDFAPINGILMDLGWSTPQFMERGRGFSFENDEPLDMRYETGQDGITAAKIINESTQEELEKIFRTYGEEDLSREISEAIVNERAIKPIETTGQLTEIILEVYRKKLHSDKEIPWIGGIHPATKVFQALRIAVNDELEVLKKTLPQAIKILAPAGRLAVITFHSLEDRIVKQFFQKEMNHTLKLVNKKPIIAGKTELEKNPSSRSAKLRVAEKYK